MNKNSKESAQLAEVEKYELLKPFTHGRSWDEAQNKLEIQMWNAADERCTFELGCRLIEARNNVESGQWLAHLKECGISKQKAALYIRVAKRLGDSPRLKSLKAGVSKIDVILQADKEDLEDFERFGILLGKGEDELAGMSRDELKDLVRKKERRLEQSKEQLGDLQEKIERLEGPKGSKDQIFEDLTKLRRILFLDIGEFKRAVAGNNAHEIALYNVLHMIQIICAQEMLVLEDESSVSKIILRGSVRGYDPVALELIDLMELSKEEARKIAEAKPIELVDDPEEAD